MNEQKVISIALWKAVGVLVFAIISSAGAGVWAAAVTVTSDHYDIIAISKDVKAIKDDYQPKDISNQKWEQNEKTLKEIMIKLDKINDSVNDLYRRK